MTLIVRHPAQEVMYCTFDSASVESLPVNAGRGVRITGVTTDNRTKVDAISDISAQTAFGWLYQKVKAASTEMPPGFMFRGDFGSSDAYLGDPVAVIVGPGAVLETDQYVDEGSNGIAANTLLYFDDDGKLSDTNADSAASAHALAMTTLTATETAAGKMLRIKTLI